jgi:hypothetical protein
MHRREVIVVLGWIAAACGPVVGSSGDGSGDETTTGSSTTPQPTTVPDPSVGEAEVSSFPPGEESSPTDPSDEGSSFVMRPDVLRPPSDCSLWDQDCLEGDKCMPWANDGGNSWNDTKCVPIDPNPRDVGESCMVEGNAVSGIDNCVEGAMCFYVDPETNEGECIAFCEGNEAEPTCDDPCTFCNITSEGILTLCLSSCDPIAQDCADGLACYPINDTFACAPDAGGEMGSIGEACEFLNVCDPGSLCAEATMLPDCEGAAGCCTPFCNVDAQDNCDALYPGTVCVPWWEEGEGPDPSCVDTGTVGACLVPQ